MGRKAYPNGCSAGPGNGWAGGRAGEENDVTLQLCVSRVWALFGFIFDSILVPAYLHLGAMLGAWPH